MQGNNLILTPYYSIRIFVLAWTRPNTLLRLLNSLNNADMLGRKEGHIDKHEVHIDAAPQNENLKDAWNETIAVARGFSFSHGEKKSFCVNEKERTSWVDAWPDPGDCGERGKILEDDLELSLFGSGGSQECGDASENHSGIMGLTTQLQIVATTANKIHNQNMNRPFLYRLVGFPHPQRWKEYLVWLKNLPPNFDPRVPGLPPSKWYSPGSAGKMWTMHFIHYCNIKNLSTLSHCTCTMVCIKAWWKRPPTCQWVSDWDDPPRYSLDWNSKPIFNSESVCHLENIKIPKYSEIIVEPSKTSNPPSSHNSFVICLNLHCKKKINNSICPISSTFEKEPY